MHRSLIAISLMNCRCHCDLQQSRGFIPCLHGSARLGSHDGNSSNSEWIPLPAILNGPILKPQNFPLRNSKIGQNHSWCEILFKNPRDSPGTKTTSIFCADSIGNLSGNVPTWRPKGTLTRVRSTAGDCRKRSVWILSQILLKNP